ncbi:hypothetical protein [Dysgonomonas sp. ZJ279]|uniref:hypothetical protein n=1 Tax=Dysgonomonas sp. ZJ279 TaxID=2709796 RepID=UPI0013EDDFF7|nr:hypothetical protein [Dysgonomonas sp. ZJ279]
MARKSYHRRQKGSKSNYLKLTVNQTNKKIMLVFATKPPSYIRKHVRLNNFSWSRKYRYWHSFLNKNRLEGVKNIYRFMNTKF